MIERLLAYLKCDLELSDQEYAAIDAHLATCSACAEEYEALSEGWDVLAEVLYPDDAMPEIDCEAMARAVLENVRKSEAGSVVLCTFPKRGRLHQLRPAAGLVAAVLVLILAVPVLAYVGHEVWQCVVRPVNEVVPTPVTQPDTEKALSFQHGAGVAPRNVSEGGSGLFEPKCEGETPGGLNKQLQENVLCAEIEAAQPHTDAEYEAWARKQYPHIMALYDILTLKQDSAQAKGKTDVPVLPDSLPDDIREYLQTLAVAASQRQIPLWDGKPVNIPDWAQRLYANTPASECPAGWRALLLYSGEIFKLDWPTPLQESKVLPSLDATYNAVLVAGYINEPDAIFHLVTRPEMPKGYLDNIVSNNALADDVLGYLAISCRLIGTTEFEILAKNTTATQVAFRNTCIPECAVAVRLQLLRSLFDGRERLINCRIKYDTLEGPGEYAKTPRKRVP